MANIRVFPCRRSSEPIVKIRVFSNTPAEGELQRGDIFLEINGREAGGFTHKQALDQIKFGGGHIDLLIERPATPNINPLHPQSPTRAPSNLPAVLPGAIQIPIKKRPDPVYAAPSMPPPQNTSGHQPKKITLNTFGGGSASFGTNYAVPKGKKGPKPFKPQSQDYVDYGVDYTKIKRQPEPVRFQPSAPPAPPPVQSRPVHYGGDSTDGYDKPPAWSSSLKPSNVPKPWELEQQDSFMPVQNTPQRGGPPSVSPKPSSPRPPAQAPVQRQIPIRSVPNGAPHGDGGDARVVHLQYNSPMGLYSGANIKDTYTGQTQGRYPMSSTATPSGQTPANTKTGDRDWSESYVYRMLHNENPASHAAPAVNTKPPPPPVAFKPVPPPPAPPVQQQYQQAPQNSYGFDDSYGTSDF